MIKSEVKWLQLSDLHIFQTSEWEIMKKSYEELAEVFTPNFIVVTGDFCHKKYNKKYNAALDFLNDISIIFNVKKENFFFVPGNHDTSNIANRHECVTTIHHEIENNPEVYLRYIKRLEGSFKEYNKFIREFYGDSLDPNDPRVKNPESIYCITWDNKLNIIGLNTSLISSGHDERSEIININRLTEVSKQISKKHPTIVLAHHAPYSLVKGQTAQLERLLSIMKVRAYLCGDEHKTERDVANKFDFGNQTVCIVCGKSAVEPKDTYSDVCAIGYTWNGSKTNVEVYKWYRQNVDPPFRFIKSDMWYHHVDKPFCFKMSDNDYEAFPTRDNIVGAWNSLLCKLESKDCLLTQALKNKKIKNKSSDEEIFKSEKIMRSLIMIGVPFHAVAEITNRTLDSLISEAQANAPGYKLDTKIIRSKVLDAIRSLDITRWTTAEISSWSIKYVRRYGHNNKTIQFYNIPPELNKGKTINDINYAFVKTVLIPDLFKSVCPSIDIEQIKSPQRTNLANEIIRFLNECDSYMLDYELLKRTIQEFITKPPHPWLIIEDQRESIFQYDRHSVESNLNEIKEYEKANSNVPSAIIIELLHHTSAMMLDCYFDFCGCSDLESFKILLNYFRQAVEHLCDKDKWDLQFDNVMIQKMIDDFKNQNISILDYYDILRSIDPQKIHISNSYEYLEKIKKFVLSSLQVVDCIRQVEFAETTV